MNYTYFYKEKYSSPDELSAIGEYDYLIAMFVDSDRVLIPASKIISKKAIWIILENDRDIALTKLPANIIPIFIKQNEDYDCVLKYFCTQDILSGNICIDSTGFKIPYLLFIIRCLSSNTTKNIDIFYSEPMQYINDEDTKFSDMFYEVKQIEGMSGVHTSDTSNDLLIIAAGYDHSRIIDVANNKKSAKKVLLFGFPSISPGMFQENIVRAYMAENAIGTDCFKDLDYNIYAPAYDPFVTAQMLKEYIEKMEKKKGKFSNIYMAPLSTKPQALGIALFFLWENGWSKNTSIIYPLCHEYNSNPSVGIARIWQYKFMLP